MLCITSTCFTPPGAFSFNHLPQVTPSQHLILGKFQSNCHAFCTHAKPVHLPFMCSCFLFPHLLHASAGSSCGFTASCCHFEAFRAEHHPFEDKLQQSGQHKIMCSQWTRRPSDKFQCLCLVCVCMFGLQVFVVPRRDGWARHLCHSVRGN